MSDEIQEPPVDGSRLPSHHTDPLRRVEGWVKSLRLAKEAPHPFVLITGLFSTLGTVLALYLTTRSLAISQQSMKVGQRAYVAISNGEYHMRNYFDGEGQWPCTKKFESSFQVENLGNTPASSIRVVLNFDVPEQWVFPAVVSSPSFFEEYQSPEGPVYTRDDIGDISQHSKSEVRIERRLELSDTAFRAWNGIPMADRSFNVRGKVSYRDVFGDSDQQEWIWPVREQSSLQGLLRNLFNADVGCR